MNKKVAMDIINKGSDVSNFGNPVEWQKNERGVKTTYQTMKEANYSYVKTIGDGQHILKDNTTGDLEIFSSTKNFAGWAIIYKNTHLEFCSTIKNNEKHLYNL